MAAQGTAAAADDALLADGLARLICGLLGGRPIVSAATLIKDLSDGCVIEQLASLWRPLAPFFRTKANDIRGGGTFLVLHPERGPLRKRDNLMRLCEALRSAGLLPTFMNTRPSDTTRIVAEIVEGGAAGSATMLRFTLEFLVALQLQRLSESAAQSSAAAEQYSGMDNGMQRFFLRYLHTMPRTLPELQRWAVTWVAELVRPQVS